LAGGGTSSQADQEQLSAEFGECGAPDQDMLLSIGLAGSPKPMGVKPDRFKLVKLEYKPFVPSGYFQIQNPWTG